MTASSAALFITGSAPGRARTVGIGERVGLDGRSRPATRVKIFERVLIWTWTSRPMTASYFITVTADSPQRTQSSDTEVTLSKTAHSVFGKQSAP